MKVVVTGTRGIPNIMGGVETHCEELLPRIVGLGGDVTIIRRSKYVNELSNKEITPDKDGNACWKGIKICDVDTPDKKAFEAIVHTFRGINKAKKLKADVLHIHAIGPALLTPYAKMLGMKVVFTHHGPDYDRDKWGWMAKNILILGEKMGCKFADRVIVISNVIKELIAKKHGRSEDVHLIYNGVPTPDKCTYKEYFDELGIEEGKYVLGMCRFVPEKNLHHLVEAFSKLNNTQFKLVLAGDTDFEDEYSINLKKMAREKGVVLTGFVKGKKLHSLLTNCACYVLPSSHEGLPISLLEAMSYDLPVIVSDIPANLEIGLDKNCYFKCGDVDELSSKLNEVIAKPFYRIKHDIDKYNWDTIAKQTMNVYQSLHV